MNLSERLRKNPYMAAVPADRVPPTKGINRKGYSSNPAAKWLKPLGIFVPPAPTVDARQQPPTPPNRHERRVASRFDRADRAKLARVLERFNRETRTVGKSGRRNQGALKASGVEIVKALAFEFWNAKTGRLDPSHETIAKITGWSVSTVARVLKRAAGAGIVSWVRRAASFVAGAWRRRTNAYQFGARTTVSNLSKGFGGCLAVETRYCETLRNIAQAVGCKFLS
jgi:hypothetical protein